jgi:hypothetical protein
MNLICPHCQNMLAVPDAHAGQLTKCSHCNQTFLVPSLPQAARGGGILEELPLDIPLAPLPPEPEKDRAEPPAPPAHEEEGGVYRLAAEPPWPAPGPTARREERPSASGRPASDLSAPPGPVSRPPTPLPPPRTPRATTAPVPKAPPPPPPPTGYEHNYAISLSPRVLQWIAPLSLVLVFFLLFFPWVGAYPGGYGVYTQSGWQAFYGGFSSDPVGEKVLQKKAGIDENRSANWFRMGVYMVLVLAGIVLAFAPLLLSRLTVKLPPAVEQLWPWRQALLGAVNLLALLLLLSLLASGFSLEQALAAPIDQQVEAKQPASPTGEDYEMLAIRRGSQMGELNLRRTVWLRLTVLLNLLALAGVGLEFWLEQRGKRLPPRAEFQW